MEEIRVVLKLGETPGEYVFNIDRRQDPPVLHIPGDHRGPDLCIPEKPEQEEWLNGLSQFVTPFWYCQWKFLNRKAYSDFLEYLKDMEAVE